MQQIFTDYLILWLIFSLKLSVLIQQLICECLRLFQGEGGGAFKGFKGFSLTTSATSGGATPTMFSGFGNGGGFKGLGSLTNGNSITPSFGGFSSPAASTAAPGQLKPSVLHSGSTDVVYLVTWWGALFVTWWRRFEFGLQLRVSEYFTAYFSQLFPDQ